MVTVFSNTNIKKRFHMLVNDVAKLYTPLSA